MEKKSNHKVIVAERARQMLEGHIRFLAQKSPSGARKTKSELVSAIRCLYQMPERFPFLNAELIPPNKYHKMLVQKRYLILYQIKDQTVYVDYIMDCRQDYGWLI